MACERTADEILAGAFPMWETTKDAALPGSLARGGTDRVGQEDEHANLYYFPDLYAD